MSGGYLTKWDREQRYWLPALLRERLAPLIAPRKIRHNYEAVVKYLCRKHGRDPDREFPLDRRALCKEVGLTEDGTRTVIKQMQDDGIVERIPGQKPAYKVDSEDKIRRYLSPTDKMQPHRRPIAYRFVSWIRDALRYMINRVKKAKPATSPTSRDKIYSDSQDKAEPEALRQDESLSWTSHSRKASCGGVRNDKAKPARAVPRVSQRQIPEDDDSRLKAALVQFAQALGLGRKPEPPTSSNSDDPLIGLLGGTFGRL